MSLKARIHQKIFGTAGPTAEFGKIGSKAAALPVKTKDLALMQTLPEYDQGLAAIVSDQGTSVLPFLEDMNSLFLLITSQLAYLMQSGIPEWDAETEYYLGVSMVLFDGEIKIDAFGTPGTPNLNFNPSTNPTKWVPLTFTDLILITPDVTSPVIKTGVSGTAVASDTEAKSGISTTKIITPSSSKAAINDRVSIAIPSSPTKNGSIGASTNFLRSDSNQKALPMIKWRMINDLPVGNQNPIGGGGSDWSIANTIKNEAVLDSGSTTESNGIFSLTTTGFWSIEAHVVAEAQGSATDSEISLQVTTDNSDYAAIDFSRTRLSASGDDGNHFCSGLIEVTDIALDKVKLTYVGPAGVVKGGLATSITFEKKSDL